VSIDNFVSGFGKTTKENKKKEDSMWSSDKWINIISFFSLALFVGGMLVSGVNILFVLACVGAVMILTRSALLEHGEDMKIPHKVNYTALWHSQAEAHEGPLNFKQPDWEDAGPEPAPSTEEVVEANIAYNQKKRNPDPPSIAELKRLEGDTDKPWWIEKANKNLH
jgi:hypothetical protein